MVLLLGVDHLIQYENGLIPGPVFLEFNEYVSRVVEEYSVSLVAEEFHEDYLRDVYFSPRGTLESLSRDLSIEHRYCDPGDRDRKRLGIPFYADVKDAVRKKFGISGSFVFDDALRRRVQEETDRVIQSWWDIRERFWFDRISDSISKNILFVCGHEHVFRFKKLLEQEGIQCLVLDRFWKEELFRDYDKLFSPSTGP